MSKLLVTAGWNHAPHLDEETKKRLLSSYPAHEREARVNGTPVLGSGRVFAGITDDMIKIAPFAVPAYWPQIVGIDFGWDHPTAAVRLAWNRDEDVIYVTSAFRASQQTPILAATAIKPWGDWIPVAWPHDGLQHDKGSGEQLAEQYRKAGLKMLKERATWPEGGNSVEAGLMDMLDRMQTSRLKVFQHLDTWFEEFRFYHRKDGKIVKEKEDLMSATRYGIMMKRFAKLRAPKLPSVAFSGPADSLAGY